METNVSVERRSFLYLGTLLDYFFLSCTMQRILFQIACFLIEFSMRGERKTTELLRDHSYVTSAIRLGGWGQKKDDNFCWVSVQFYVEVEGGLESSKNVLT